MSDDNSNKDTENSEESENEKEKNYEFIKKHGQVWKFCFYGFFKNLKFFEPYLFIILLNWGYSLLNILTLQAITEIISYLFEVPSGILADRFGKKRTLMACFVFYIISFLFYFSGPNYLLLVFAAIFFGFGEAFRSGTHKAMEIVWLENHGLLKYKTFLYGRTRSYSLYGSTISHITSIVFILSIPADRWIFLITIIPYVIDFILIASYPDYMNDRINSDAKVIDEVVEGFKGLKVVFKNKKLGKGLFSSSTFNSIFKSLKDWIQPIIKILIAALLITFIASPTPEQEEVYTKLILGLIYATYDFLSSYASKNAYKINKQVSDTKKYIDLFFDILGICLILTGVFFWLELPIIIMIIYLPINLLYNVRRPMTVDYIATISEKDKRATILSVESLLKSILVVILAPLFGFIADITSIPFLFVIVGIGSIIINRLLLSGDCNPGGATCELEEEFYEEEV
ncbi:MAG: hypothetical protein GF364_02655 [Candidatus Lokiarchaeota archaeon]|nr:hypothetical protein [Candidatus Lokiarchaeota archaeon]